MLKSPRGVIGSWEQARSWKTACCAIWPYLSSQVHFLPCSASSTGLCKHMFRNVGLYHQALLVQPTTVEASRRQWQYDDGTAEHLVTNLTDKIARATEVWFFFSFFTRISVTNYMPASNKGKPCLPGKTVVRKDICWGCFLAFKFSA